ncbi:unnamed protein product [Mucor circinelloides]
MNVLSAFTDQRKIRPVYQFKRGTTFASPKAPGVEAFKPMFQSSILPKAGTLQQSASSSSSVSSTAEELVHASMPDSSNSSTSVPDEDKDDAIFDFPASLDEFVEIKVMVASNRTIPEAPKLTRKRSKPKKKTSAAPTATTSKPKPTVNHTKKRPIPTAQRKEPVAATTHIAPQRKPKPQTIMTTSPPTRFTNCTANTYIPMPAYQTNSARQRLEQSISIASLLNEPSPLPQQRQPPQPAEKKRKRNLVAHLKTASGEKENKHIHQEFDCLSDEDDLALEQQQKSPVMPLNSIIKDRSLSPEPTYEETMQMQLDLLMQTECGESPSQQLQPASERKPRPQYQPSNKLNVRVTFQKKQ